MQNLNILKLHLLRQNARQCEQGKRIGIIYWFNAELTVLPYKELDNIVVTRMFAIYFNKEDFSIIIFKSKSVNRWKQL